MSKTNKPDKSCKIAVIGIGCIYPGAHNPLHLWENILSRRRQFREMPDVRLPNHDYYDPDPLVLNKTYQNKAAVIDGYSFDWLDKKIPKQTFESTDIVHWLALDTALQAIEDAGYSRNNLPGEKTGAILGNTLTGEFTRSNQMLLRWPYVRKALRESAKKKGLSDMVDELESTMEAYYKSVFHPVTEDTLAGGLANTIAGRICNYLDVHGGGYIVDGACSSSLLAIVTAANYLELHQMDMVIAGGVDISLDTFELIGFAKTGALTSDEMRVYDINGRGFLPGEGCGMVVLKRLEDAIRDNNPVYAVIDGWGISSDGKGGITAPSVDGQSRALIRAGEKAGIDPVELSFIEGHGTGTKVGDKVEIEAITNALQRNGELQSRHCGVTSFKSIVGHTKAAAGIGAFIKTAIALNRRIIPPTANIKEPNPVFVEKARCLYPVIHGEVKNPSDELYAGVSAMGFGGINSHVILHSGSRPFVKLEPVLEERKLMASVQTHELFLFTGHTRAEVIESLKVSRHNAKGISYAELSDLACFQNEKIDFTGEYRAAIIAETPFNLEKKIDLLITRLNESDDSSIIRLESGTVIAGQKKENLRIGAAFPGQGSQRINMARKLVERYDWARTMVKTAADLFERDNSSDLRSFIFRDQERASDKDQLKYWQSQLKPTDIAQPTITLASLLWFEYLKRLGIRVSCVTGHSLGELMAFHAAGLLPFDSLLSLSIFRGKSMAVKGSGSMASLQCSAVEAQKFIQRVKEYATIANINAPQQTVISGTSAAIKNILQLASEDQISGVELPVSAAFHSDLIADVAGDLAGFNLPHTSQKNPDIALISSMNGNILTECNDLNTYFASQATSPVDFISSVNTLKKKCDIVLEIGPGRVLSGLISSIDPDLPVFPVEPVAEDDLSLNVLLGAVFVSGSPINTEELYKDRLIRPFIPASLKNFIVNPLEKPFPEVEVPHHESRESFHELLDMKPGNEFRNYLKKRGSFIREMVDTDYRHFKEMHPAGEVNEPKPVLHTKPVSAPQQSDTPEVQQLVYRRIHEMTGFNQETLNDQLRLLDDLNLDSIKSATLVNGIAKTLGIPGKLNVSLLSNAPIGELIHNLQTVIGPGSQKVSNQQNSAGKTTSLTDEIYLELARRTGFPREALSGENRLLDDLNMDSIKAGSFISHLQKKFNIQKRINAGTLANSTINQIIKEFSDNTTPEGVNEKGNDYTTDWVNSYTVELQEESLPVEEQHFNEFWNEKCLVILHDEDINPDQLNLITGKLPVRVIWVKSAEMNTLASFQNCCILVLVPRDPLNESAIRKTVRLLTTLTSRLDEMEMIGFLQFNDGLFVKNIHGAKQVPGAGVVSFAASLHHERPELMIRVVETDKSIQPETGIRSVMQEFLTEQRFDAVGYDASLLRRRMAYRALAHENVNDIADAPSSGDVFVATGGAKGITAECMFALAKESKCKTALLGSSAVTSEIESLLDRYRKENLEVSYYQCDITDALTVKNAISDICKKYGTITGVLHGAGRNVPAKAERVAYEDALKEMAPKISGFFNLHEALQQFSIKHYIALTSIIGITGMPGNSWYAFSNENLDLFLRSTVANSKIQIRTIAYSIWDEIGMGVRLGSNSHLASRGIGSINPEAGIREFLFWVNHENTDQQIVISSRMGGLDTWNTIKPMITANRFLKDIRSYEPGREISARVELDASTDLYLNDHNYSGSLLFPTVFGLEAMAQVSCFLAGVSKPAGFTIENISLRRPVVVPPVGSMEIGLSARLMENGQPGNESIRIFAGISTEDSGFTEFHFSGEFTIHTEPIEVSKPVQLPDEFLKISPESDLYSWLLFQGPKFQHIDKMVSLDREEAAFITKMNGSDGSQEAWSEEIRSPMIAGNPLLRDVLLQSVQIYLTGKKYLPVSIKRWDIYDTGVLNNRGLVNSALVEQSENRALCNVEFVCNDRIVEKITGYEVKALESTPQYPDATKIAALDTLFREKLNAEMDQYESFIDGKLHINLYKHDKEFNRTDRNERHEIENGVFSSWINTFQDIEKPCTIAWAPNGKPVLENRQVNISLSHSRSVLMMTMGAGDQGCDIEYICNREREEWEQLTEGKFSTVLEQLKNIDHDDDVSFTRIWCVKEALIKSLGMVPLDIRIEKTEGKGVFFRVLATGNESRTVLTFPVELLPSNTVIISTLVTLKKSDNEELRTAQVSTEVNFNRDLGAFTHTFLTTFRDCRGFYGKTHFTSFIDWMGSLRELVLTPIGKEMLNDLGSGEYGMVTNASEIRISQEAGTLDQVTGNLRITDRSDLPNSLIDLEFMFYKNEKGKKKVLADCSLSTTWVKIEDRGVVKKAPIPGYFIEFLKKYKATHSPEQGIFSKNDFPQMDLAGKPVYKTDNQLRPPVVLHENTFSTGLSHSNTVGNLYYSNYYVWQSLMIDEYLYQRIPDIMTGAGRKGEFLTLHSTVNHLQEAMPFEDIAVSMYIRELTGKGITFYFEYFSVAGTTRRKLAYGSNSVVFCKRTDENSIPVMTELPVQLVGEITRLVTI
ncbi:MAG TPA: SDR family NAD(P)-dependent oxidoreductase [Bacteroidales bacterium]|nr:SDR family NAD(P)-dependent oxidoreductase [Bacteroidales bacterium]